MRRIVISLVWPLIGALLMTSCLGEGETAELTSTVALRSFKIKDLKVKQTILKADGTDSTYTSMVSGSTVEFIIDQANYLVYNPDSITYGANVNRVLVEVTADGGIYYLKPNGEAGSVEDSIDFTQPVTFRVTSYDEQFARDYKVTINVHQTNPEKTEWKAIAGATFPKGLFTEQKAFVKGDNLYVLGFDADNIYHTASAPLTDATAWTTSDCNGIEGKSSAISAMLVGETFYLTTDAGLYSSHDAINWSPVGTTTLPTSLLAVEDDTIWAIGTDGFLASQNMVEWNAIGQQPQRGIGYGVASFSHPLLTNEDIMRTIFIATPEVSDTCAQVWTKLSTESDWQEVEPKGAKPYGCPNLEDLVVIHYADKMYAFGGKCIGERRKLHDAYGKDYEPFSACFESRDNGLTWKPTSKTFALPKEFKGRTGSFSATTDGEYVWVMWSDSDDDTYGEVWRGRWNGI